MKVAQLYLTTMGLVAVGFCLGLRLLSELTVSRMDNVPDGGARGCFQRAKNSITTIFPPEHGHGARVSGGSLTASSSGGDVTLRSFRASAMQLVAVRSRKQPVVKNTMEPTRQHVEQEAADELVRGKRHHLPSFGNSTRCDELPLV
jgi:hypothetical protein